MIDFCKKHEAKEENTASQHVDNDGISNAIPIVAYLAQAKSSGGNEEKKNEDNAAEFPEDTVRSIIGSIIENPDVVIRGVFVCKLLWEIITSGNIKTKLEFAKLLNDQSETFLNNENVKKDGNYQKVYKEVRAVMDDAGVIVGDGIKFDDKKRRFKSHRECVATKGDYGKPCGNPGSFKGPLHNILINGDDFKKAVLDEIESGGDNCARLQISASIIGAMKGYDVIPSEWINKVDVGKEALTLCDSIYKESKL